MRFSPAFYLFTILAFPCEVSAQEWGAAAGRLTAADDGRSIPGASVIVDGTNFGTATEDDGRYELRLPMGRYLLRFSSVGFVTRRDSIVIASGATSRLDVVLEVSLLELDEIRVEDRATVQAGVFQIDPDIIRDIPTPIRDALRALKVLPGVATNNELSNQYSVRGGGFNENLIFVNGFEIFLPFRPRNGEQEGLSLLNGELAERITFYSGGFPARYGGKLSSAVDIEYRKPQRTGEGLRGSAYASLLDMGVSASSSFYGGRGGWLFSARRAQQRSFFEKQELKGNYQPQYTDLQGMLAYNLAPGHEVEALAMIAEHEFRLDPSSRRTFFGTLSQNSALAPSNLQSLWVRFDDSSFERDGYSTQFGGLRLSNRWTSAFRVEHDVAYFKTEERERFDLKGSAILFLLDPGQEPNEGGFPIGNSQQEDFANNRVNVTTLSGQGRYLLTRARHAAEMGWSVRKLEFDDHLDEKSVVIGRSLDGDIVRIVADSLRDQASFSEWQAAFHAQDAFDVLSEEPGRFLLTTGLRADYFSFTGEWTLSPRVTATFKQNEFTTLFGSLGVYYQMPSYRELRGKPEIGESILGALNRDLNSQRSIQAVGGLEYFIEESRYYVRAEVFYKYITDVISYDVKNVRVLYSGENDAKSKIYGLDLQLRGEFVPGMESWVNYSFLVAREKFSSEFETEFNKGTISRPTDQRHTVSMFIQDYIPADPTWRLHLRTLFGSGIPYTPPVPGQQLGNIVSQAPGPRFSARYPSYFRFDMGVTKRLEVNSRDSAHPITMDLTAEMLNIFDMTNTVAYTWIPNATGIWTRIPTRLTPRTVNVRLRLVF
ncbi:MAG: TonB-dependent receptor [Bacteroidetes bacterium]|nr:TonB-dependent receptor [Bacteroidota bacterium]